MLDQEAGGRHCERHLYEHEHWIKVTTRLSTQGSAWHRVGRDRASTTGRILKMGRDRGRSCITSAASATRRRKRPLTRG